MADHSIAGSWRGHYGYAGRPDEGSRFDIIFEEENGALTGSVLDLDFAAEEATLAGSFSFPVVKFTKVYVIQHPLLLPIEYQGTMSDDGKTMRGTWQITFNGKTEKGSWNAHRNDEKKEKEREREKEVSEPEGELEEVY